jgi:hypothetical protein
MDQNNTTAVARHRVLLCLQQTAEPQYSQRLPLVAAGVVDRGNLAHQVQWTTEEPAAELVLVAVVDQTQETVLTAVSVITAGVVLTDKDIRGVQVLDLMRILKILTKVAVAVAQVVQVQVLQTDVNDIVHLLEATKLQAALAAPQTF